MTTKIKFSKPIRSNQRATVLFSSVNISGSAKAVYYSGNSVIKEDIWGEQIEIEKQVYFNLQGTKAFPKTFFGKGNKIVQEAVNLLSYEAKKEFDNLFYYYMDKIKNCQNHVQKHHIANYCAIKKYCKRKNLKFDFSIFKDYVVLDIGGNAENLGYKNDRLYIIDWGYFRPREDW